MHLIEIEKIGDRYTSQADPYILKSGGRYYIYVTGDDGVYAYDSDNLFSGWQYRGRVLTVPGRRAFWAPCVIELAGRFYMYNSIEIPEAEADQGGHTGLLHVSAAERPLGPFTDPRPLLKPFSIDPHVVQTAAGLFLFYSTNQYEGERAGTYIVVDRLTDPYHAEGRPVKVVEASLDEEIFQKDRFRPGQHWHTLEGAYYFQEGDWQYVMFSGNCYEKPTYYVGYARAKTRESDLRKIAFAKYPDPQTWSPVLKANEFEEGTGHHSLIKENGQWYAIYHARDYAAAPRAGGGDARSARICKLHVADGVITAERYQDHI